ncbi:arsenite methyltransferase-like [Polypterus senegalus]|uniref:arsenite methyltransferase-like n=1 Tax=Polypterus senegalus TaxID=55291 RepID=UPI0019649772|nr:arsenite methyltransferase-like [Polypterus senegalus]
MNVCNLVDILIHRAKSSVIIYEVYFSVSQDYYGKHLQSSGDLKTNACKTLARPLQATIQNAFKNIHPEVVSRYYGCGMVVPECLEGCRVLDLGCGAGRDCFLLSQLVGEEGHVTGIDMTEEQIAVAQKYVDYHAEKFGFKRPNVNFLQGYIETLQEVGLQECSYDVIISNCVINLSPDKKAVLKEAYRVLKDGGEMYFSDVYVNKRLPKNLRDHKVLLGECLGGALWWLDLIQLAQEVGFCTPRLVSSSLISINNKELESLIEGYQFVSATFRLFRVPKNIKRSRYQVIYNGSITDKEDCLDFDASFKFKEGEVVEVDEELATILKCSRFVNEFMYCPMIDEKASVVHCRSTPKVCFGKIL